jgi:hypothetical protein
MQSNEVEGLRGAYVVEGFILGVGNPQSFSIYFQVKTRQTGSKEPCRASAFTPVARAASQVLTMAATS